jgi:lipopolysaccharide export system protein LptC
MMNEHTLLERLRSWLPLLPPLLLLAGTYWLNLQVQPLPPKEDDSKRHDIDYAVENLSSVTLDEHGKARHMMTTEKMWHYPDDDTTHLQTPRLVSLHANRAPLVIWAQTGTISSRGEDVFLYDDVKVMRLADTEQNGMQFSTDYLHVIPDKDLADTDHPVTVVSAHDTIHAVGMTLDNKARNITFLSDVHATHETVPR